MWQNDDLFRADDPDNIYELGGVATPAFRVSAQSSTHESHPLDHVEAYDRLFQVFKPLLKKRAERLLMTEKAGAKSRRRKSIKPEDWTPFQFMKDVVDDNDRRFVGFDFVSGKSVRLFDKGPTGFRMRVGRSVQLDATISVEDFENREIDIDDLKQALLHLPVRTALAGYGMATSCYFDGGRQLPLSYLLPVAKKYPAIDVCPSPRRSWFPEDDHDFSRSWISGVNWLTLVGEPFLSAVGGPDVVLGGLPDAITADVTDKAVLCQLGERPITGQKGVDDALLPLYHALGRKLQPRGTGCPSKEHPRSGVFRNGNDEVGLLWERRFYDGKWFEEMDE